MPKENPTFRKFSYMLILAGLFVGVVLFLDIIRTDKTQQYLDDRVQLLDTIYHSSLDRYAQSMEVFFSGLLQRADIMPLLQAGIESQGSKQDRLRSALYQQLLPDYRELQARGIHQLQFHLADGRSYLRFHAPSVYGDSLLGVRPSLQQLQIQPEPLTGFEVGRLFIGFRFLHPLIDEHGLFGSMETAVSFQQFSQTLNRLAPGQAFLFLLQRERVEDIGFDELRRQLLPSRISDAFLLDDQALLQSGEAPLPLEALLNLLAEENLGAKMQQGDHISLALYHQSLGYSAVFIPVHSIDGNPGGYILSLHPEPLLTSIQWEFYTSVGISLMIILLLGWLVLSLFQQRQRVMQQKQRLDAIGQSVGEGIYVLDPTGQTLYVNTAACSLTGYNAEKLYTSNLHHLLHHHPGNSRQPQEQCPIFTAALSGRGYEGDELFRIRTGQLLPVMVTSRPMLENGVITGVVTVFRDISERKENERKLEQLATTDPLTGLYNRRAFIEHLQEEQRLCRRLRHTSALMMIDFDHFKAINDRHGHQTGDEVLQHFANQARSCLRETDHLGRLGGEEFALLLPGTDLEGAHYLAERIRLCLEEHPTQTSAGQSIPMTLSIGLTLLLDEDADTSAALNRADKALYDAKRKGRNRVEIS